MITVIGIDPGTSGTALAAWDKTGPFAGELIRAKGGVAGLAYRMDRSSGLFDSNGHLVVPDLVVVEGQQIDRRSKSKANILTLAQAAGIAMAWAARNYPGVPILVPTPTEWKGQVAKHAHQARLYSDLGWGYTIVGSGKARYARPESPPPEFSHISPGAWRDVGDAILLARWGYDKS
jgi:hypothetical protein